MKNKKLILILSLIAFVSICFIACENPIINKWWVDKAEPEYIPLFKIVPQVSYETIIQEEIVYKTVFVQLPPETVYQIVYEEKPVYEYIYEQLPPEVIYETVEVVKTVYQDVVQYIYVKTPPDKDSIIEWLKDPANQGDVEEIVEKIKELYPDAFTEYVDVPVPPEIIYQEVEVIKTVYQDVVQYIYEQTPPDKDSIIQWLKDPTNQGDVEEIIRTIKEQIPIDVIKEIIKEIPPKDIMDYLTDEQIQYIVSKQPPQKIFQSIKIIGIEYVLFAGDSSVVNGPHGTGAQTNLTDEEKAYNTSTIQEMAELLNNNPTYIAMLHGHANPVTFTDGEKSDLTKLSNDRANDVKRVLLTEYNKLPANPDNPAFDDRVSTSGYGGEKVLFGNNTTYTALNRRVEMILFEIVTTVE
jgi:arsenate reductase-like glutaredoxin family protein